MGESKLTELLDRVKAAAGPDRELDADVTEYIGDGPGEGWTLIRQDNPKVFNMDAGRWIKGSVIRTPKPYTASVDAALALTERVLPGWVVADLCQNSRHAGGPWGCTLDIYYGSTPSKNKSASSGYDFPSAPLAILSATLSALLTLQK